MSLKRFNILKANWFIFLISLILLLTSCSKQNKSKYVLTYWSSNNTYEIKYSKMMVEQWNKVHPDKLIKYQPVPEGQSSEEVILAAVVGETTPDIYSNMWQGDVEQYAHAGVVLPLDKFSDFYKFMYARSDSSVLDEVKSQDGHIYQVPWKINPIMMIYNSKLLSNLGINNPPKTYAEFYKDALILKNKSRNKNGYVDRWFGYSEVLPTWWQRLFDFYPLYLAASGGKPLIKNNKAAFNNKYSLQVFNFLRTLYKDNYFSKERLSAQQDIFLSGVIASRFTGPWDIAHTKKFAPKGFEFNFSTMPVPDSSDEEPITYCDPKNIVIFNTCKNPEIAWEFLKFFLNGKNEKKFLEITNQLPRRKDLLTNPLFDEYFNKNPLMMKFAEQTKRIRGIEQALYLKEVFDIISQEYEASVIYGVKSTKQALMDAEKAVNLLYLK